jgi:hypothetical protein
MINNDIDLPDPEQTQIDPSIATDTKIGNGGKLLLIIIAAVCLVICLCAMICIGTGVFSIGGVVRENAGIKDVMDEFMQEMSANNIDGAYALFSPHSREQTSIEDLGYLRSDSDPAIFLGYEGVRIHNLSLDTAEKDGNGPQGFVATVAGEVLYKNRQAGYFSAVLEKVKGKWMFYSIDLWLDDSASPYEDVIF